MTTRTVAAMFKSRAEAEQAMQQLISELQVDRADVRTSPESGMMDTDYDRTQPYKETGFFGSLKSLFLPDEDRYAYAEGMRRGHVMVSAQVDDSKVNRAADILERAGALDLDTEEAGWRQSGWVGYDSTAHHGGRLKSSTTTTTTTPASTEAMAGRGRTDAMATRADEVIPLAEEQLVVGKRMVERGRVRVRTYVVERPVEAQVTLRDETVHVERRTVDRPLSDRDSDAFKERVIEATETDEVPIVGKETRIVEEVALHKSVEDRTETVRDTVRRTEVDVDDEATRGPDRDTGMKTGTGSGTMTGHATGGTMSHDPGSDAPDGTPGNPPGTVASRAVDKTLGTNISGANPDSNKPKTR